RAPDDGGDLAPSRHWNASFLKSTRVRLRASLSHAAICSSTVAPAVLSAGGKTAGATVFLTWRSAGLVAPGALGGGWVGRFSASPEEAGGKPERKRMSVNLMAASCQRRWAFRSASVMPYALRAAS